MLSFFSFLSILTMDQKILCFIPVPITGLGLAFGEQSINILPLSHYTYFLSPAPLSHIRIISIFTNV